MAINKSKKSFKNNEKIIKCNANNFSYNNNDNDTYGKNINETKESCISNTNLKYNKSG